MKLNWLAYNFERFDGYGRYGQHMVRALIQLGVEVTPIINSQLDLPAWLQRQMGIDYSGLTIACMPPYMLRNLPGRQWALSMTEGSRLPEGWQHALNERADRVIVPCKWNQKGFIRSGMERPINVVPGGTCPAEFPVFSYNSYGKRPYTFLALGDRGARKGWVEVYRAFFETFGKPQDTPDVRLIIKTRPHTNSLIDTISGAMNRDPRLTFWQADIDSMADVYAHADCIAMPSRSEGWGMPHREAAMTGKPVLVTNYSGLKDGHTAKWGIVVKHEPPTAVPQTYADHMAGNWAEANIEDLGQKMRWCYEHPAKASEKGQQAAQWLRKNQTWKHAAEKLLELIERYG